jgi:hypothetical protein
MYIRRVKERPLKKKLRDCPYIGHSVACQVNRVSVYIRVFDIRPLKVNQNKLMITTRVVLRV